MQIDLCDRIYRLLGMLTAHLGIYFICVTIHGSVVHVNNRATLPPPPSRSTRLCWRLLFDLANFFQFLDFDYAAAIQIFLITLIIDRKRDYLSATTWLVFSFALGIFRLHSNNIIIFQIIRLFVLTWLLHRIQIHDSNIVANILFVLDGLLFSMRHFNVDHECLRDTYS